MTDLDSILKSRANTLPTTAPLVKAMVFFSSHVWMWELGYKGGWAWQNWWFCTVGLEKTLESPLDSKDRQSAHPKGNQSWIFIGRTDAEVETPVLWPPDVKNWLIWKDPDAGKDWIWEQKGRTWDDWMASLTQRTWVWVNPRSCWLTEKPRVLQSMGLQRVRQDWTSELNWREACWERKCGGQKEHFCGLFSSEQLTFFMLTLVSSYCFLN